MAKAPKPSIELRLRVLAAVDYAPGATIRERIKHVASRSFTDADRGIDYRFTWRTISTWLYRFKKRGLTTLDNKTRADRGLPRKVSPPQLAEAIHDVLPSLSRNKQGQLPKSVLYRRLLEKGLFTRRQLAPTTFYRRLREHRLLDDPDTHERLRLAFAMPYANDLWQADTLHGPAIRQADGTWRKTFLVAFLDDASRVVAHAEFFYRDDTASMVDAFRCALFKRGKPQRLYFDNGSNYRSTVILQACLRLGIHLSHAPIRDGAAKGKIERFFRGFRDRFLTQHTAFHSLAELNAHTQHWVEHDYNDHYHSGIQMKPLDRFNLDIGRLQFLTDDAYSAEAFFLEFDRKVSKTNVFSLNAQRFECPVDLRGQTVQVRFDRQRPQHVIVFYAGQRMGEATVLDPVHNALARSPLKESA
ncbi:DDE-type integrase/transposase/recombinase [Pseudomarimonas arenosa]|uniref:DDE-type integrase/transposase/recombinase n=1 Tax=Pseudomarimonas arenosa TaxID=2774145 RepID=A0AAW3ZTG6_9GAMM|nr:DDE-type integrase/transposase/recombinase [Pseudomarimonas arenosa]MBD8528302.1 DDE-type integrase/transposase/recombinase [Pseudomarimonas arenosa]